MTEPIWHTFTLWSESGQWDRKLRLDVRHVVCVVSGRRRLAHAGYCEVATIRLHDGVEYTVVDSDGSVTRKCEERAAAPEQETTPTEGAH